MPREVVRSRTTRRGGHTAGESAGSGPREGPERGPVVAGARKKVTPRKTLETNQANDGWTGRNPRMGNRATMTSRDKEPAPNRGALEGKHTNERGWRRKGVDYTGRADE